MREVQSKLDVRWRRLPPMSFNLDVHKDKFMLHRAKNHAERKDLEKKKTGGTPRSRNEKQETSTKHTIRKKQKKSLNAEIGFPRPFRTGVCLRTSVPHGARDRSRCSCAALADIVAHRDGRLDGALDSACSCFIQFTAQCRGHARRKENETRRPL